MEGDREVKLEPFLAIAADAFGKATRRDRDVASADRKPKGGIRAAQKGKNVIVIIKRLAGPHDDDVGDALPTLREDAVHDEQLAHHLGGGEVPFLLVEAGGAERAAHGAADFARDADGVAVIVGHEDRLDLGPVFHLEEQFDRAVASDLLAVNGREGKGIGFLQGRTKGFRHVGHGVEVEDVFLVDPGIELLGAVRRLAEGDEFPREFL